MLRCLAALFASLSLFASTASAAALDPLGAYDPGTPGLNATAVGLDGIAYLGSWGGAGSCPALGVRLIDVHDPAAPVPLGVAAVYSGTTAEHVAVGRWANPTFSGSVLLAGIQRCAAGGAGAAGLALWDVTIPSQPAEIGFLSIGRLGRGVHEFALSQRGDRAYAYLAVPNSETSDGRGDVRIVDVTDPRQPIEIADWGARRDAGVAVGAGAQCAPACRGGVPQAFGHSVSVSADGLTAYVSYWDQGLFVLDVSNPAAPMLLGHFREPASAEGNTHSVALAHQGKLALVGDETFGPPWGRLRLVDVQDPSQPVQVGVFDSPNSAAGTAGVQYAYTLHNALADDRNPNRAYLAWYADGVRVIDVSDASQPIEIGAWVPPSQPMVWNVAFLDNLLLVADVNNGLYVLER